MTVRFQILSSCLTAALLTVSTNVTTVAAAEIASPGGAASEVGQERDELAKLVDSAIDITARRYLNADVHTPWQIMHGLLALRGDFQIRQEGRKITALQWLTEGRTYNGLPIVEHSPYGGRFHTFTEPYAFEGHPNQFLAILTMSELSADYTFKTNVDGKVTIHDMLRNAQMEVNDREEITWTLWALSRYLPVDSQWNNKYGDPWSIERLVQIQTYAEPNDAACGGTHGLFALSLARNAYLATGKQPRGIWFEADQKIRRYVAETRSLQNSDGSLSTKYFGGPGYSPEFGKRLATSGHVLEFLMVGARDKDLRQEWLRNAVRSVAQDLVEHRRTAADCGPLYHALHALVLYRQRIGMVDSDREQKSDQPDVLAKSTPKVITETPAKVAQTPAESSEPVFVANVPETAVAADVASERPAPKPELSASIKKPSADQDAIRGLFEPAQPTDTETVDEPQSAETDASETEPVAEEPTATEPLSDDTEASVETEEAVTDEGDASTDEEDARTPEDNAPEVIDGPQIMDDGYKLPQPPTMD